MAKCYFCGEPTDNKELYPYDDTYVRVCPDCMAILNNFGRDYYEKMIDIFYNDFTRAKEHILRMLAKKTPPCV